MSITHRRGIVSRVARIAGVDRAEVEKTHVRYYDNAVRRGDSDPARTAQSDLINHYGVKELASHTSDEITGGDVVKDNQMGIEHRLSSALSSTAGNKVFAATAGVIGFNIESACEYLAEWGYPNELDMHNPDADQHNLIDVDLVTLSLQSADSVFLRPLRKELVFAPFYSLLSTDGKRAFDEFLAHFNSWSSSVAVVEVARAIGLFLQEVYGLNARVFAPGACQQLLRNLFDRTRMLKEVYLLNDAIQTFMKGKIERKTSPVTVRVFTGPDTDLDAVVVDHPVIQFTFSLLTKCDAPIGLEETTESGTEMSFVLDNTRPRFGENKEGASLLYAADATVTLSYPGVCYTGLVPLESYAKQYLNPILLKGIL